MPESKRRKRPAYTAPDGPGGAGGATGGSPRGPKPTPRWWAPVMLTVMITGLLWIVVFYLSGSQALPVPRFGAGNLGVGFGLIIVGFAMTTRWR